MRVDPGGESGRGGEQAIAGAGQTWWPYIWPILLLAAGRENVTGNVWISRSSINYHPAPTAATTLFPTAADIAGVA